MKHISLMRVHVLQINFNLNAYILPLEKGAPAARSIDPGISLVFSKGFGTPFFIMGPPMTIGAYGYKILIFVGLRLRPRDDVGKIERIGNPANRTTMACINQDPPLDLSWNLGSVVRHGSILHEESRSLGDQACSELPTAVFFLLFAPLSWPIDSLLSVSRRPAKVLLLAV